MVIIKQSHVSKTSATKHMSQNIMYECYILMLTGYSMVIQHITIAFVSLLAIYS